VDSHEPSRAARNVSDRRRGYLVRSDLHHGCLTGNEFIAILHHEHEIASGASIAIGYIAAPTNEKLDKLKPVDGRGIIRKCGVNIEDTDDMVRRVPDIDVL
jgi:hypothetical protein